MLSRFLVSILGGGIVTGLFALIHFLKNPDHDAFDQQHLGTGVLVFILVSAVVFLLCYSDDTPSNSNNSGSGFF